MVAEATLVFGYDGHGSTRFLAGPDGAVGGVRQAFDYDAYGKLLGPAAVQAATSLLYRGETFDARVGMQCPCASEMPWQDYRQFLGSCWAVGPNTPLVRSQS